MRTGTRNTKYGHKREGNTGHGDTDLTLPATPLPTGASRTVQNSTERGGGALEASRDIEKGQEASRLVLVLGSMVEQGARAAMAEQGTCASLADPEIRAAMASPPPMAVAPAPATMAGAMLPPPPPKKKILRGSRGSIGHLGALWEHRYLGALARLSVFEGPALGLSQRRLVGLGEPRMACDGPG